MTAAAPRRKRKRSFYEPLEVAGAVRRIARAMIRRAETGDTQVLSALRVMAEEIEAAYVASGGVLKNGPWGYSWSDLGQEVGITRQAAEKRFGVSAELTQNAACQPNTEPTDPGTTGRLKDPPRGGLTHQRQRRRSA